MGRARMAAGRGAAVPAARRQKGSEPRSRRARGAEGGVWQRGAVSGRRGRGERGRRKLAAQTARWESDAGTPRVGLLRAPSHPPPRRGPAPAAHPVSAARDRDASLPDKGACGWALVNGSARGIVPVPAGAWLGFVPSAVPSMGACRAFVSALGLGGLVPFAIPHLSPSRCAAFLEILEQWGWRRAVEVMSNPSPALCKPVWTNP